MIVNESQKSNKSVLELTEEQTNKVLSEQSNNEEEVVAVEDNKEEVVAANNNADAQASNNQEAEAETVDETKTEPVKSEPQKTYNSQKAYDFIYQLSEGKRDLFSDDQIARYSSNKDRLLGKMGYIYALSGQEWPGDEAVNEIYQSFFDEPVDVEGEKKNTDLSQEPGLFSSEAVLESAYTTGSALPSSDIKRFQNKKSINGKTAQGIRGELQMLVDGTSSTVKMASGEADGKYYAYPTIFPKEGNTNSSNPEDWLIYEDGESGAMDEAFRRGEVFEFKDEQSAINFAKGAWKADEINPFTAKATTEKEGYQENLDNPPAWAGQVAGETFDKLYAEHNQIFNESSSFSDYIKKSNLSWFNKNEEEAEEQFKALYGRLGFTVNQKGVGQNTLEIISPDGVSKYEVRLFTESYMDRNSKFGDMDYRNNFNKSKLVQWMSSEVGKIPDPLRIKADSKEQIVNLVNSGFATASFIPDDQIDQFQAIIGNQDFLEMFDQNRRFLPQVAEKKILQALSNEQRALNALTSAKDFNYLKGARGFSPSKIKEGNVESPTAEAIETAQQRVDFLQGIADQFLGEKQAYSAAAGQSLLRNGGYDYFDFANNNDDFDVLKESGILPGDVPLRQIQINGRTGTYNEAILLLKDFQTLKQFRLGNVDIDINLDGVKGSVAKYLLEDLDSLKKRNKADKWKGYDKNNAKFKLRMFGENTADFFQTVGLAGLELVSMGFKTALDLSLSVNSRKVQEKLADGPNLLPNMVKNLKEEYLPLYGSGIKDARTFGEFMAKGTQATANSLPVSAIFAINPVAGLVAVGVNSYGTELYNLDTQIAELKNLQDSGVIEAKSLNTNAKKILEMNRLEARSLALSKATSEVAFTRLFTYGFFRDAAAAKNFAGAKNQSNLRNLASQYTKYQRLGITGQISYYTGLSRQALLREVPEESLIAANSYAIEVAWGIRDYDPKEFSDLLKETGITSAFSSLGIARAANFLNKKQVRLAVDDVIKRNVFIDAEVTNSEQLLGKHIELEKELAKPVEEQDADYINQLQLDLDVFSNKELDYEKRKDDLLERMSNQDKKLIIDLFSDIVDSRNAISNVIKGGKLKNSEAAVINKATELINLRQAEVGKVILKYTSEDSFPFLPVDTQQEFLEKAADAIVNEKFDGKKEGLNYTFTTVVPGDVESALEEEKGAKPSITKKEIYNRAIQLYIEDANKSIDAQNRAGVVVMPGFTASGVFQNVPLVTRKQIQDFDLNGKINTAFDILNQGQLSLDIEQTDDTEQTPTAPLEGDVSLEARNENQQRLRNILGRLQSYNQTSDFMSLIGYQTPKVDGQAEVATGMQGQVVQFFKDIEDGRTPNLGTIEAIVDAVDISVEMLANMPQDVQIKLTGEGVQDKIVNAINNYILDISFGSSFATGNKTLASTTVLANMVFRDSKQGKLFLDLNQEASRIVAEVKQSNQKTKQQSLDEYDESSRQDDDYKSTTGKINKKDLRNPNGLTNSYEMSLLGLLYRLKGENNIDGVDVEFQRNKNLILQELQIRKEEYEANPKDDTNKVLYFKMKEIVDKLKIGEATSYEQVSQNASPRNAKAIEKLAELQPKEEALKRIKDYNRFDPTVMERYLPSFYKSNLQGGSYMDAFGIDMGSGDIQAGQLKDVSLPQSLGGEYGIRLDLGTYFDQAYGALQGLNLDINGRKTYRTLSNLMQMPSFMSMFEGNTRTESGKVIPSEEYQRFMNAFMMREQIFDMDIQSSHRTSVDYGDVENKTGLFSEALNATYTTLAAINLTRLSQNTSQFQSAVNGAMPMMQTSAGRNHLIKHSGFFYAGLSGILNGNESKTARGRYISDLFGITPYARNIYAQSQTGLRNALASELIANQNKKYPISYYLSKFDIDESSESAKVIRKALPKSKTFYASQFLNFIARSNEASLEVGLAMGDRAAAHATFEAHYIDYRVRNGAEYSTRNPKDFWEKENKNPDLDAIRYADEMVDRTQLQNTSTSTAGVYSEYAGAKTKNITQALVPYQKFIMNARVDIASNYMKLQDPNVNEEDKIVARKSLQGRFLEVATFAASRNLQWTTLAGGLAGTALLVGTVEEEDVERLGGITPFVGKYVGFEDRDIIKVPDVELMQTGSIEEQRIVRAQTNLIFSNLDSDLKDIQGALLEYENKFKMSNYEPDILRDVVQESISVGFPLPRTGLMSDAGNMVFNYLAEHASSDAELREFTSNDLKGMNTNDGLLAFVTQHLGSGSIALEQFEKLRIAHSLAEQGAKYKYMPLNSDGQIKQNYSALTDIQKEKIAKTTQAMLFARYAMIITPIPFKGDVAKVLDRMERQIEIIYSAPGTSLNITADVEGDAEGGAQRRSVLESVSPNLRGAAKD